MSAPTYKKGMRKISKIIVHCTDSDDSLDIGFREINDWHKQRGFLSPSGISCGYHYVIRRNGSTERGRPDEEAGAHVKGHNANSIGVVWVGRNQIGTKQLETLNAVLWGLLKQYSLEITDIYGHKELFEGKTCPNLDMNKLRANLLFYKAKS